MVTFTEQKLNELNARKEELERLIRGQQEDLQAKQQASPGGRFNQEQSKIRDTGDRLDALNREIVFLRQQQQTGATGPGAETRFEEAQALQQRATSESLVFERERERRLGAPVGAFEEERRIFAAQPTATEQVFQQSLPADIRDEPARDVFAMQSFEPREKPVVFATGMVTPSPTIFGRELTPAGERAFEIAKPTIEFLSRPGIIRNLEGLEGSQAVAIGPAVAVSAFAAVKPGKTAFFGASEKLKQGGILSEAGFKTFEGIKQVGRVKGFSVIKQQGKFFQVETFAKGQTSKKILTSLGKLKLGKTKPFAGVETAFGFIKDKQFVQVGAGAVTKGGGLLRGPKSQTFISAAIGKTAGKFTKTLGATGTKFQSGLFGGLTKEIVRGPKTIDLLSGGGKVSGLSKQTLQILSKVSQQQTQSIATASLAKGPPLQSPGIALLPGFLPKQKAATVFEKPTPIVPRTIIKPQPTQALKQAPILKQEQFAITLPAQDIQFKQATGLAQPQIGAQKQKGALKQKGAQQQIPMQKAIPRQGLLPRLKLPQPLVQAGRGGFAPFIPFLPKAPPRRFKPFPFLLPSFDFLEPIKPRKTGQREFFRQPSFAAAQLGITAPSPGPFEFTGLFERPLLKRRKKRK